MEAQARKRREADFHDRTFSERGREEIWSRYYGAAQEARDAYAQAVDARCRGAAILEYGCGIATRAFRSLDRGAEHVTGIDISPVAVEQAQRGAADGGYQEAEFRVMDAEDLDFPDRSFDLICGTGILHHLDLDVAYAELRRVLRPGGLAIFVEPLGHNPVINGYRRRTPHVRTVDEHPLLLSDIDNARRYFGDVEGRFFGLLTLAAFPLHRRRSYERALRALQSADRFLFRVLPYAKRHAWQVVLELKRPLERPSTGSDSPRPRA